MQKAQCIIGLLSMKGIQVFSQLAFLSDIECLAKIPFTTFTFLFFLLHLLYRVFFFLTSYLSIECTIIILICIESVSNASRFRDASINPLDSRHPLLNGSMAMSSQAFFVRIYLFVHTVVPLAMLSFIVFPKDIAQLEIAQDRVCFMQ